MDLPKIDEIAKLRQLLDQASALLLDFDGPICSLFSNYPAATSAHQLRDILADCGYEDPPLEIAETDDPFKILNYSATLGVTERCQVESALRTYEQEASRTAKATPGSYKLIKKWFGSGRHIAIVSNNSTQAVAIYLERLGLSEFVTTIAARTDSDPNFLKPNTHLLELAQEDLQIPAKDSIFVGDSLSDIIAAHAVGMPVIGLANKPEKVAILSELRPDAIIRKMEVLNYAID